MSQFEAKPAVASTPEGAVAESRPDPSADDASSDESRRTAEFLAAHYLGPGCIVGDILSPANNESDWEYD